MNNLELIELAKKASENAHSPYSNFCVGTALLTKDGKVYTGCNVENHGIQSICGERVAFTKAISEGEPSNIPENYIAIAIVGHFRGKDKYVKTLPCGYCRQFMSEFAGKNFEIYSCDDKNYYTYTLGDLLPEAYAKMFSRYVKDGRTCW